MTNMMDIVKAPNVAQTTSCAMVPNLGSEWGHSIAPISAPMTAPVPAQINRSNFSSRGRTQLGFP